MTTFSCTAVNSSGIGLNGNNGRLFYQTLVYKVVYILIQRKFILDNWDSVNSVKSSTQTVVHCIYKHCIKFYYTYTIHSAALGPIHSSGRKFVW